MYVNAGSPKRSLCESLDSRPYMKQNNLTLSALPVLNVPKVLLISIANSLTLELCT